MAKRNVQSNTASPGDLLGEIGCPEPYTIVDADSSTIAIRRWGKGPPIVCLHAIGHGARDFELLAERISEVHEVIALDWPEQGRSPPDGQAPRANHYARIARKVISELDLDRPIVLGNSIGGAAAIELAYEDPALVRGLVLCSPGGLIKQNTLTRFIIRRMVGFFNAGANNASWYGSAFKAYYSRLVLPKRSAKAQRERIIRAGYHLAPVLSSAWSGFAEETADLRSKIKEIDVPIWYGWAKSDHIVSWRASKAAAKKAPKCSVTLFRGGHAPFLEDPDRFAKRLLKFTKRLP